MDLVNFFAKNNCSILEKNRKEIEFIIGFHAKSRKQQDKLLAELKKAERIWQTAVPKVKISDYLW